MNIGELFRRHARPEPQKASFDPEAETIGAKMKKRINAKMVPRKPGEEMIRPVGDPGGRVRG